MVSGVVMNKAKSGRLRGAKKEPPKGSAALKVDNREASNRVDRSHSVSKRGQFQS